MFEFFKKKQGLKAEDLSVELMDQRTSGVCPCCNNMTRTVWGAVRAKDRPVAIYYVNWTQNGPDHGARIDLIMGEWGDHTSAAQRRLVSVEYRVTEAHTGFMVVDASKQTAALAEDIAQTPLTRNQVIGTPLAKDAFALLDAIWLGDDRLTEIHSWTQAPE